MQNKTFLPLIAGSLLLTTGLAIAKPSSNDFFNKFDKNNDGKISLTEFNSNLNESFARIDKDESGSFDITEFKQHNEQRKAEYEQKKKARHTEKKQQKFKALDANADGILTESEYVNAAVSKAEAKAIDKFSKFDGSHANGSVTEEEFMQHSYRKDRSTKSYHKKKSNCHGSSSHRADNMFSKMDADNNGRVSLEEYKQSRLNWFNKLDADNTGSVSRDELKQAHSDRRKK